MSQNNRYDKNSEVVRKIGKNLGFELSGYDPDWLVWLYSGRSVDISDEVMGIFAKLCGENWVFNEEEKEIKNKLKDIAWELEIQTKAIAEIEKINKCEVWAGKEVDGLKKYYKEVGERRVQTKRRLKKLLKTRNWLNRWSKKIKCMLKKKK